MANSNSSELVDVHAHFLTEEYVSAAVSAGIVQPDGMPMWPSWSIEAQLELMQHNRIRHAVLSMSTPGVSFADPSDASALARHVNDFAVTTVAAHPGRFSFFASLPLPDVDAAVVEAQRAIDRHAAAGVVLLSNHRGQYLGDAALDPLWVYLNARQSIVFVHPTSPPHAETVALGRPRPMIEFMFETTRTVTDLIFANVVGRYPDIKFLIPHCGAALPLLAARIEQFRSLWPMPDGGPPGPLTTETQLRRLWFDLAGYPMPTQASVVSDVVGTERILYGSDFCWTPAFGVAKQVAALDADRSIDWRRVTSENAQRVLGDILAV
ncbi:amidohydrolase [Mycolicibacterium aromaticivorans JS19b1 = JCM 16368]|uniref:6-methylsalicylate decarboxylase n=1 Tax=Mycolicibacterium aromaticivorans JS19b1 = JCM 16368 TaxID=1440774 RepID=A0A064CMB5_9MYCO|nr:amidohydrolase family protein [Mycolicibacterium aromaticivorans]KDE99838.1 amidohydrolase [Mycolicibacterium aromaticivorans JS19b1 = JCM 16368]